MSLQGVEKVKAGHILAVVFFVVTAVEVRAEEEPASLFREKCSLCHPLERVMEKTDYTARDWQAVVDNMMEEQDCRKKVSPEEAKRIKKFLSRSEWQKEVPDELPQP